MKCIICNQNKWKNSYIKLVKCTNCGLVRAQDKYFAQANQSLYDISYFNGTDYFNYELEKKALIKNFDNRLKRIKKLKKRGTLLEVGCAYGYFLSRAENIYQTTGIDLNKIVTKLAKQNTRRSSIITGDLLTKKIGREKFDIVALFDVIEHLKDPKKYLQKSHSLLKKNGVIVIETGNIGALLPRVQKSKWRLITPPTHLYYFNVETLTTLLINAGFSDIKVSHVTFNRTLAQTFYRLTRQKVPSYLTFIFDKTFPIYTGDLMFVTARKRNIKTSPR